MTDPFTLRQIDELVTRSHSDGITDLAAAALIEPTPSSCSSPRRSGNWTRLRPGPCPAAPSCPERP